MPAFSYEVSIAELYTYAAMHTLESSLCACIGKRILRDAKNGMCMQITSYYKPQTPECRQTISCI